MSDQPSEEPTIDAMTDCDLLTAFQRTDGTGAEATRLLEEIERRCLDI
jgi:hypothetical protein